MLNLRYIVAFLSSYTIIGAFCSIVTFCNLYSMDQDDDDLSPEECLKKFSTTDSDGLDQPLDISLITSDSDKSFVERFTKLAKKDPQLEKRTKILDDYDSLYKLMPDLGHNILSIAFAYEEILDYAKKNISSLPEDQKIDLYLYVLLLHYQLFPDPSKELTALYYADLDAQKSRSMLLSVLHIDSNTNFEEHIDKFLQEVKSIDENSTRYISYYLSSLAHEMFSIANLDPTRITLDHISGKIETIHQRIEALCYSIAVYLVIDKLHFTPTKIIPKY